MIYRISHSTKYTYSQAVPVCHNLVHLKPRSFDQQTLLNSRLLVVPEPSAIRSDLDFFGNHVASFAVDHPHSGMSITSKCEVEVNRIGTAPQKSESWEAIANQLANHGNDELLSASQFVFSSPYVSAIPELESFARESFPPGRPIIEATLDLTARIFREFVYDPKATTVHTPLSEVMKNRRGVCQDFAHLQIGCLRSLGLAARYVSGYLRTIPPPGKEALVGADASHAWLSVFCGDAGWIDVDPTNNILANQDHITVAWGRDYSDVCPIRGVIVGGGEHKMTVEVDVAIIDPK